MDYKKLLKKLLYPRVWVMALLTVLSAAGLVWVFVSGLEEAVPAYFVYVVAFYTLSVVTLFCVQVLPGRFRFYKEKLLSHPLGRKLLTDKLFRTRLSLQMGLIIGFLYVGLNLWSWYWVGSNWFMILSVYYGIMVTMRFLLARFTQKTKIGTELQREWRMARLCACILLLVNLSLSGAVLMILYQNRGYDYPGMLIYVMALYTFYSTTHAIIEIIRTRKLGSPILSTIRIVSLCAALVSMLNLETAMFAQFGQEMAPEHQRLFIILTGAGISIAVVTLSILLIHRANTFIRRKDL